MAKGIAAQVTYGSVDAQLVGKPLGDGPLLKVAILHSGLEVQIQSRLAGAYNLPNILAAVAVGHYFGIDIDTIKAAMEQYTPSNSRSQWLRRGDNEIILDAYNANPTSMKLALENMAGLPHDNKWLLLGAMKEMGAASGEEHQALIHQAEQAGFKNVLLCGPEFEDTQHAYRWFPDSEALKDYVVKHPIHQALILIKGSRGSKMELVLEAL
jgi:UDP-N-acetylmuramoyl-tripeptide--D-alanyl-D-alanine ligase